MKGIFVVLSGISDLPSKRFNGLTALEAASVPNLDFLATRGKLGYMVSSLLDGEICTSKIMFSIFGERVSNASRSYLEAVGMGAKVNYGDLVFAFRFGSVLERDREIITDERAGFTLRYKDSRRIVDALNKIEFPVPFEVILGDGNKCVVIFRGDYSDAKVLSNYKLFSRGGVGRGRIGKCLPAKRNLASREGAEIMEDFIREAKGVLRELGVNKRRVKKGFLPINCLLVEESSSFKFFSGKFDKWMSVNYTSLEKGIGRVLGMRDFSFSYPKFKGYDVYSNFWRALKGAVENAKKMIIKNWDNFDYCYVHFKELDYAGHDNKPMEKKAMIEYLDKTFFRFLARVAPMKKVRVVVCADHSTPCSVRAHTRDFVPVLSYSAEMIKDKKMFGEKWAKSGELRRIYDNDLFEKTSFFERLE